MSAVALLGLLGAVLPLLQQAQPPPPPSGCAEVHPSVQYSNWTSKFDTGSGTINIIDSASQKTLLSIPGAPLTPGPLVVVRKCPPSTGPTQKRGCWPPSDKQLGGSVETIAASYVPPKKGSGVRLFTLSPDTSSATMTEFAKPVATDIKYGLASEWAPVPSTTPLSSTITDAVSGHSIATDITTPPKAPAVFTLWLIGNQTSTGWDVEEEGGVYGVRVLSLKDSPHNEQGEVCPSPAPQ